MAQVSFGSVSAPASDVAKNGPAERTRAPLNYRGHEERVDIFGRLIDNAAISADRCLPSGNFARQRSISSRVCPDKID